MWIAIFPRRGSFCTDTLEIMRAAEPKIQTREPAGTSYVPVSGKTYSLFGTGLSTEPYYERIRMAADEILSLVPGEETLLSLIREVGGRKRFLARAARRDGGAAAPRVLRPLACAA